MWVLPGPGIEPVSPALVGGFLTTEPPGSPPSSLLKRGKRGSEQGWVTCLRSLSQNVLSHES